MHTFKLISLALVLAPVAAHAQVQDDKAPTGRVKLSDIDPRSPAGRAILARRIDTAAEQLCPPLSTSTILLPPAVMNCRAAAVRAAQIQIAELAKRRERLAAR